VTGILARTSSRNCCWCNLAGSNPSLSSACKSIVWFSLSPAIQAGNPPLRYSVTSDWTRVVWARGMPTQVSTVCSATLMYGSRLQPRLQQQNYLCPCRQGSLCHIPVSGGLSAGKHSSRNLGPHAIRGASFRRQISTPCSMRNGSSCTFHSRTPSAFQ
jgi:hypothetical protein